MSLLYDTTVAGVEALGQYRVWVSFADGTEGEVDLSGELTNDAWEGALAAWHDPTVFAAVRIGDYGIAWGDDGDLIDIEDEWLYGELKGLSSLQMYPTAHAIRVVDAELLEKYRVRVRFADNVEGEDDLGHLAGEGVFQRWDVPGVWEGMRIASHRLVWESGERDTLHVSNESMYKRVAGITWEELCSVRFVKEALRRLTEPAYA